MPNAGYSLEQAQAMLTSYLAAEQAILAGQSYSIAVDGNNSRALTRANLAEVVASRKDWEMKVASLSRQATGRGRTRYFVG